MLEAVLKASSVMIVNLILVLGIGVLSAYLPEERMELILVSVLLEIIQNLDLVAVSLEVGPYVPVNRNNNLTPQVLSHTKDIDGCHLILHTDGVLTEGTKGNIDIIILTMLCKVNGEVSQRTMMGRLQSFVRYGCFTVESCLAALVNSS